MGSEEGESAGQAPKSPRGRAHREAGCSARQPGGMRGRPLRLGAAQPAALHAHASVCHSRHQLHHACVLHLTADMRGAWGRRGRAPRRRDAVVTWPRCAPLAPAVASQAYPGCTWQFTEGWLSEAHAPQGRQTDIAVRVMTEIAAPPTPTHTHKMQHAISTTCLCEFYRTKALAARPGGAISAHHSRACPPRSSGHRVPEHRSGSKRPEKVVS